VYIAWPLGSMRKRPQYGFDADVDAAGTPAIVFDAGLYSKKNVGAWNVAGDVIGPAVNSTLPLGRTTAGASTAPTAWPGLTCGIVGPCTQVPAWLAIGGGVYSAVKPVAPI